MGYRINERNTGSYSLEGNMKQRRTKKEKLTAEEKQLAKDVLMKVYGCMEKDDDLGYTDGGRFMLCLSKQQWETLLDISEKL